jgi:hypothetical protein
LTFKRVAVAQAEKMRLAMAMAGAQAVVERNGFNHADRSDKNAHTNASPHSRR